MDQKTPLYQQKNCDILVISVKIFDSRKNANIRIPISASLMPKCTYCIFIFFGLDFVQIVLLWIWQKKSLENSVLWIPSWFQNGSRSTAESGYRALNFWWPKFYSFTAGKNLIFYIWKKTSYFFILRSTWWTCSSQKRICSTLQHVLTFLYFCEFFSPF
jgi:hypothetical protein